MTLSRPPRDRSMYLRSVTQPPPEFFRRGHPYTNRCVSSGVCADPQHTVEVQSLRKSRRVEPVKPAPGVWSIRPDTFVESCEAWIWPRHKALLAAAFFALIGALLAVAWVRPWEQ